MDCTTRAFGEAPTLVFEAVGRPQTLRTAIDLVRNAGRVVAVGLCRDEVAIPVVDIIRKDLTLLGTRNSCGKFPQVIAFLERHRDNLSHVITDEFPLEEAEVAIRRIEDPNLDVMKVVLRVTP